MSKHLREGGVHDYMHPVDEGYKPKHKGKPKPAGQHRRDCEARTDQDLRTPKHKGPDRLYRA